MEHYVLNSKKNGWVEIDPHLDFENTLRNASYLSDIRDRFLVLDDNYEVTESFVLMELTDREYDPVLVWVEMNWDEGKEMFTVPDVEWYDDESNGRYCMYLW